MSYSSKIKNQDTNNNTKTTPFNLNNTTNTNDINNKSKEQELIDEYNYKQKLKEDKKNRYKYTIEKTYNVSPNTTIVNNIDNIYNTDTVLYNPDFCIQPRHINIYNKKYCMKWLTYKIDDNYYHYDYCVKLFELLMKWVKYNNFVLKTNERALLGKFISLMYLLSNKKDYYYNK